MFSNRKRGRSAAVFTAVAGLLLTAAATASAADPSPPPVPTIVPGTLGSITITKMVNEYADLGTSTGLALDPLPANAKLIDGVGYTVVQVDLNGEDLTTQAGWQAASQMTVETARPLAGGYSQMLWTGAPGAGPGVVKFSDLPLGLYLVTETAWPSNVDINGDGIKDGYGDVVPRAKPFLITVPMTNPDDLNTWEYNLHVYPKNDTMSLEKTIVDGDAAFLNDYVTFEVKTVLPEDVSDMTSLTFTDVLDPRLAFALSDEDFRFGFEPTSSPWSEGLGEVSYNSTSQTLTVVYNNDYLKAHAGEEVGFTFRAQVIAVGNDGIIANIANYVIETPDGDTPGGSNEVVTKWGGYDVAKVDEMGAWLEGAVFDLYQVRVVDGAEVPTKIVEGITSTSDGEVWVDGLRYSRWADGAAIVDTNGNGDVRDEAGYVFYRLVETKAPADYELQPTPFDFEVTGMADRDEYDNGIELTVVNVPHNAGFELPAIGGNRAVLPIVAAVIAAGGVVWLIRSRREQDA